MNIEAEKRLEAFEKMLASVQERYQNTVQKMEKLKAEGRVKTVTFRQLMTDKLMLQNILSMYQIYGLTKE